jgi:hypothetical protein
VPAATAADQITDISQKLGELLGRVVHRSHVESRRLSELMRAARTPEGRERDLVPLLALTLTATFVAGLALGVKGHHPRHRGYV